MTVPDRLAALRRAMLETQLDAYIVPSTDPHQSEYPAPRWAAREWLSGFTGSAGTLVVTHHEAFLWTDSRYFLQAPAELEGTGIELMKDRQPETPTIAGWLGKTLLEGQNVGADGRVLSENGARRLRRKLEANNLNLVTDEDLVRRIWTDRPPVPNAPVYEHKTEYAGETWQDRLTRLAAWVSEQNLDHYVVSALDDIAWTLNLRGSDIDHNPLAVAYLIVGAKGHHALFSAPRPNWSEWTDNAPAGHELTRHDYGDISSYLRRLNALDADIGLDGDTISTRLCMHAGRTKTTLLTCPVAGWKARKTDVALDHLRRTMAHDAVALLRLFRWLEDGAVASGVTEYEVGKKLTALRAEQPGYVTDSFPAIVGYAGNGAIVHYRAPEEGSATLRPEGLLLLDSGGQYLAGTTDITRTVALGPVSEEMREHFTRVLQGHIALTRQRFPAGTVGSQLDTLARHALWNAELDYGHGTGHGVGFFLNVHEGPMGINQYPKAPRNLYPLEQGMILSNEPGYYATGEYGIRTENLVAVQPGERTGWLRFENLTLFPIDRTLIVQGMLTKAELEWINDYHAEVLAKVSPLLDGEDLTWLETACAAL